MARKQRLLLKFCFLMILMNIFLRKYFDKLEPQDNKYENYKKEASSMAVRTIQLQHCNCTRQLMTVLVEQQPAYNETTCSEDAYARGGGQKVVAFSFYINFNSTRHLSKQYLVGIQENLKLIPEYYPGWVMRLYYDLDPEDPILAHLCQLACINSNIDICNVKNLPGTPMIDARKMFAMNWRFFPTLDPQVDLYLCRDLDSRFSWREVSAVTEWIESGLAIHSMRDHVLHTVPLLGAAWGARLTQQYIRKKWKISWDKILDDRIAFAERGAFGPDQSILQRYIWPWGMNISLQHDSYNCGTYPESIGFPTQRRLYENNNFVAAVVAPNISSRIMKKCPEECRRIGHTDWEYC